MSLPAHYQGEEVLVLAAPILSSHIGFAELVQIPLPLIKPFLCVSSSITIDDAVLGYMQGLDKRGPEAQRVTILILAVGRCNHECHATGWTCDMDTILRIRKGWLSKVSADVKSVGSSSWQDFVECNVVYRYKIQLSHGSCN